MENTAKVLESIAEGDPRAAQSLFPLVYDELKKLAEQRVAKLTPGQTLQPTALVHEAYLRLIGSYSDEKRWASQSHFYHAAAEAMRHVQIDAIRKRNRVRRGGGLRRLELTDDLAEGDRDAVLLDVHDVIDRFAEVDPATAELVKLHIFAGFNIEQAAEALGLATRTAYRDWAFARAWMGRLLGNSESGTPSPSTT